MFTQAAEHENASERCVLLDSSCRNRDQKTVALLDKVSSDVVILTDNATDRTLHEVLRIPYHPSTIEVTTMHVQDGRDLIVVAFGGEPIGNATVLVFVYDLESSTKLFSEYAKSFPSIEDVTGDEEEELVMYYDYQEFQHPEAPLVPVVYNFTGKEFVLQIPSSSDEKWQRFFSHINQQFLAFRNKLKNHCDFMEKRCSEWEIEEIDKATMQIETFRKFIK